MNVEGMSRQLYLCPVMAALIAALLLILGGEARSGTTSTLPRFTIQGPAENSNSPVVRDALNRPCLDVQAMSRAHVVNPQVMDDIVSVKNNCPKVIKVKVCYLGSETCNLFDVQGYKRVDTVLGSMSGRRLFRYTIRQQ